MSPLRTGALGAATLLCLSPVLAGCGSGFKQSGSVLRGESYVALGDSYTAAPGTGSIARHDGCYQSVNDYPHLVAEQTGATLTDRSCVGASTAAITGSQKTIALRDVPAQADALDDATSLVTVGIGANDFGLYELISKVCPGLAASTSSTRPCTQANATGKVHLSTLLHRLRARLVHVLRAVRERAPSALVLAIGYPDVVPASGTCGQLPLAPGDYPFARSVIAGLNRELAAAASATGARYVDVFAATAGHDICAAEPWVAGRAVGAGQKGAPWHPYAAEQRAVATLVEQEVRDYRSTPGRGSSS